MRIIELLKNFVSRDMSDHRFGISATIVEIEPLYKTLLIIISTIIIQFRIYNSETSISAIICVRP